MIENVKFNGSNDILIEYDFNAKHKNILFSELEVYWSSATEELFEGGSAVVHNNTIIFTFMIASCQGGVIVVYDVESEAIIHISEGAYCIKTTVFGDYIYYLCEVSNYSVPCHYQVFAVKYGTKDATEQGYRLHSEYPCRIYGNHVESMQLDVNADGIRIVINDGKRDTVYKYASTADVTILTKVQNQCFGWLYSVLCEDTSKHQLIQDEFFGSMDLTVRSLLGWIT